ncbi:MAG: helix-turn-helix domain-containing protein, partial [Deltaproteobacteria bacterium]|nr:helix-turn-helix domain-containing protein [Candidatus Desulfobacula maris]
MITPAYRQIILEMISKGVSLREVSRILNVSRNTVRRIIKTGGTPEPIRESKYHKHLQEIKDLFRDCRG